MHEGTLIGKLFGPSHTGFLHPLLLYKHLLILLDMHQLTPVCVSGLSGEGSIIKKLKIAPTTDPRTNAEGLSFALSKLLGGER